MTAMGISSISLQLHGHSFTMAPPRDVEDFAPIYGRHQERRVLTQGFAQQVTHFFGDPAAALEEADKALASST